MAEKSLNVATIQPVDPGSKSGARGPPRVPDDSHRVAVIGRTGSGKTVFAIYSLAWRSYDRMPWIAIDFKGDEYLARIGAEPLEPNAKIPKDPGIYHVQTVPENPAVDGLLMRGWERGRVGFYIDEGYGINARSDALKYVLTQGRALKVPVIICTQRPVWVCKFALSEADFFQVFPVIGEDDRKTVRSWTGLDVNYPSTLDRYYSYNFDVGEGVTRLTAPAPFGEEVLDIFDRRKPRKVRRV